MRTAHQVVVVLGIVLNFVAGHIYFKHLVKMVVMYDKTRTFFSVSFDEPAVGTDNGLPMARERAAGAGDEGLVQSVPGFFEVSLQ